MTTNAEVENEVAVKPASKASPKSKALIPPEKQKSAEENEAYYREWGKQRIDCTIQVANPSADRVIALMVPNPANPRKSVKVELLCGERIHKGVPIFAVEQIENAYTIETKEIPKHRRQGDIGLTHEKIRMPLYTVKRHGVVENPAPIGSIKSNIAAKE